MSRTGATFSAADREELALRGIAVEEAERQLALLRHPPPPTRLDRPCTPGDGIEVIAESVVEDLVDLHAGAAREGRFTKFVPASGAASRMFADLAAFRGRPVSRAEVEARARAGDERARGLATFLDGLDRFPFAEALARAAGGRLDEVPTVLDALLGEDGLDYAAQPKALIPFHRYGDDVRTALEEHLVEAAAYTRDRTGTCRLHLTVSPEHREGFDALLERVRRSYESAFGVRYEVTFSVQAPSTDVLALDPSGEPFRLADGTLLFRPGGHGALIENLADLGADLVFVKNIDNVVPDRLRGPTVTWKRVLAGRLVDLERRIADLLGLVAATSALGGTTSGLEADGEGPGAAVVREGVELCRRRLHAEPPEGTTGDALRGWLVDRLRRPLRVCGVVRNTGEPGGGPFWVRDADGSTSLQIVEGAQVDRDDPEQRGIYATSTHFSPTDLVCSLRDTRGNPYPLRRFVDPTAVFVADKTHEGRPLRALERPGLWNGAMARWSTVFVEVPLETFTPVKTVSDLLRPEHQP